MKGVEEEKMVETRRGKVYKRKRIKRRGEEERDVTEKNARKEGVTL